jgi:hypothetical protein
MMDAAPITALHTALKPLMAAAGKSDQRCPALARLRDTALLPQAFTEVKRLLAKTSGKR